MSDHMTMSQGPGVIVVAEQRVTELLTASGVEWCVQERQSSTAQMWDALASGRLDAHSRILVFSDSLHRGAANEVDEREQTARAIVAMANARAHVFVAVWHSAELESLRAQIDREAVAIGVAPDSITVHFMPMEKGDREALECMRVVLDSEMSWPQELTVPAEAPGEMISMSLDPDLAGIPALSETMRASAASSTPPTSSPASGTASDPGSGHSPASPTMPHLGIGQQAQTEAPMGSSTSGASQELLARPPLPGQVTITVTSSKGGSGKSTAALLLAASIARASKEGGKPLSVCVVDMDTRDGQVASLIGKYMPTALNIRVQPVWDEMTIQRHLVFEEALGVHALLAPIRPRTADTVGPEFYRTIIRSLQRMFDVVVMDTSVQYLDPLIAKAACRRPLRCFSSRPWPVPPFREWREHSARSPLPRRSRGWASAATRSASSSIRASPAWACNVSRSLRRAWAYRLSASSPLPPRTFSPRRTCIGCTRSLITRL